MRIATNHMRDSEPYAMFVLYPRWVYRPTYVFFIIISKLLDLDPDPYY
jgi:hypothetical protein